MCTIANITVHADDIARLQDTEWLNDEVRLRRPGKRCSARACADSTRRPRPWVGDAQLVNAYMKLIAERSAQPPTPENPTPFPSVHVFSTFFYEKIIRDDFVPSWTRRVRRRRDGRRPRRARTRGTFVLTRSSAGRQRGRRCAVGGGRHLCQGPRDRARALGRALVHVHHQHAPQAHRVLRLAARRQRRVLPGSPRRAQAPHAERLLTQPVLASVRGPGLQSVRSYLRAEHKAKKNAELDLSGWVDYCPKVRPAGLGRPTIARRRLTPAAGEGRAA